MLHEKGEIKIKTTLEKSMCQISISDTGQGVEKKNLKKIMDPFFTTKSPGEGTGLGLSISYRIIQEHSGNISVHSDIGKGTTFIIGLPLN